MRRLALFTVSVLLGCSQSQPGDGADGSAGESGGQGSAGTGSEDPDDPTIFQCGSREFELTGADCYIDEFRENLQVHVDLLKVTYPEWTPGRAVVDVDVCHASTLCRVELVSFERGQRVEQDGQAVELGSAVHLRVEECPETVSGDGGDDVGSFELTISPTSFELHASDCRVN